MKRLPEQRNSMVYRNKSKLKIKKPKDPLAIPKRKKKKKRGGGTSSSSSGGHASSAGHGGSSEGAM